MIGKNWFFIAVTAGMLPSCESTKLFLSSPGGIAVASAGGAYIVREAVLARPEVEPVLEALLARYRDPEEPVDFSRFEDPLVALGTQIVGDVALHYGEDSMAPEIVADSISVGLELARAHRLRMESSK